MPSQKERQREDAKYKAIKQDKKRKTWRELKAEEEAACRAAVNEIIAKSNKVHRKLSKKEYALHTVENLFGDAERIRELGDWRPRRKSNRAIIWDLIQHLYCKYPVAKWWRHEAQNPRGMYQHIFLEVGAGESLYKIAKRRLHITPVLTKKMCHSILTEKKFDLGLVAQVRYAQFMHCGGSPWMAQQFFNSRMGEFSSDLLEDFKFTVIQWLCNRLNPRPEMFQDSTVRDLVDYFLYCYNEDRSYSVKGRTLHSAMGAMALWHDQLAVSKGQGKFEPCGLPEFILGKKNELDEEDIWTITEILTGKELAREGRHMHHCVYSYKHGIQQKLSSIWSLQKNGHRVATIQVRNQGPSIVQVRGKYNKEIKGLPANIIYQWARDNLINVSQWAFR